MVNFQTCPNKSLKVIYPNFKLKLSEVMSNFWFPHNLELKLSKRQDIGHPPNMELNLLNQRATSIFRNNRNDKSGVS